MNIKSEIVVLTPELAQRFLGNNDTNRPISQFNLNRLQDQIKRGQWRFNGEPIIVFNDGSLGDGQHRCLAVVQTGIPIQTMITYGIDKETFSTINSGKSRGAADVLAINGAKNTNILSAAARAYVAEFRKGRDAHVISSIDVLDCVKEHPHINYWCMFFNAKKKAKQFFPSSIAGYMAIASERYGIEKIEVFANQLLSGENLSSGDPALTLRNKFIEKSNTKVFPAIQKRAYMVKAINAFILGKKLSVLRLTDVEENPTIV